MEKVPGISFHKANNIKFKFAKVPKKNWCIDGEELEDKGLTYDIRIDRDFKMMLPKKNIGKLFLNKK